MLTIERKKSALSFHQFLKNYFAAFMEGRAIFENLTPAIGKKYIECLRREGCSKKY